jgi:hypothetical protein
MSESNIDYNQVINDYFLTIKNPDDFNMNIFDFFNKYPTTKTFRCPDGTIINMSPNEPAVDKNQDKLPIVNNIPQGEEATRMIVKNVDSGVVISSPPGVYGTYFITRYGSPSIKESDYPLDRYDDLRKMLQLGLNNLKKECFFNKFKCDTSPIKCIIAGDYDNHMFTCSHHKKLVMSLININVATSTDLKLFVADDLIMKYTFSGTIKKRDLLKKIKDILNLAESGKLLNRQLDPEFVFMGVHYYPYYSNNMKKTNGWSLLYHDYNDRIAHIYLNELTTDIDVIKTIELFSCEIISAKHNNDLPVIKTYLRYPKKQPFTLLEKTFSKPYNLDIKYIVQNNMIY